MKVVFTTTIYLPHMGGIEVCIHEMAQYLISKGHQVKILVADTGCYEIKKETIENELVIRYPAREICNFFVLKRREYLRDIENEIKDADVVHINVCKFLLGFLSRKKRKYNYKLIMTSHGWIFHTNTNLLIKKIFFKLVVAKNAKNCDSIINVSNPDQKIAESFGIKDSYVIVNGVDLKKFSNIPPKSTFENKFLYFGRISANKGIYECLQKLSYYEENFAFYIVGKCEDEAYMEKLKTFITSHGMENKVIFYGKQTNEEIRNLLQETDVILMPSLHEGFGMTLVECLPAGRPVIANTIESFKSILESLGAELYLFDYQSDATMISDKIKQLRTQKVELRNIDQYSVDRMLKKTYDLYL